MLRGGLFAGAVAGLVASLAVERSLATTIGGRARERAVAEARRQGAEAPLATMEPGGTGEAEASTGEGGSAAGDHRLGGFVGALYGLAVDVVPLVGALNGLLFGAVLWYAADEKRGRRVQITREATGYSTSSRLYSLASYLVYGFVLESVRRSIRWLA